MIDRCLHSIAFSLSSLDRRIDLRVHVIADNCSDRTIDAVKGVFGECELQRVSIGNAGSFCLCVDVGTGPDVTDDSIVFMLEDDYLFLDNDVFSKMAVAFQQIGDTIGKDIGIMPDDYPDRYRNH